ncbi:MAG: lysophospholipase [Eubacteriaceae bacterium]|nr:lysophospholipase [Eubacteriaceae bacterium]
MESTTTKLQAKDGASLDVVFYPGNRQPEKGLVLIVHGFGEHAGSYNELIEELSSNGYSSAIYSQRGHGDIEGKLRGVIPSYEALLDDISIIAACASEYAPAIPLVLYGHSMGGNIAVNYLLSRSQSEFCCVVLESPWFGLYKEPSSLVNNTARLFGSMSGKMAINNKLAYSDMTSDEEKAKEIEEDALYHNRISFRLYTGVKNGCQVALKNGHKLVLPAFIAYTRDDKIVKSEATELFAEIAGIKPVAYDSCHAIRKDRNRQVFYKDLFAFLAKHTS